MSVVSKQFMQLTREKFLELYHKFKQFITSREDNEIAILLIPSFFGTLEYATVTHDAVFRGHEFGQCTDYDEHLDNYTLEEFVQSHYKNAPLAAAFYERSGPREYVMNFYTNEFYSEDYDHDSDHYATWLVLEDRLVSV